MNDTEHALSESVADVTGPMPLALKLIAFQYFLIAVLDIVEMLLRWFVLQRGFFFCLTAILATFIGRGLLRGQEWSRKWACGLAWLMLVCAVGVLPFALANHFFGVSKGIRLLAFGRPCSPGFTALTMIPLAAIAAWQIRVLGRNDIVERFRFHNSKHISYRTDANEPKRFARPQFSLSTLFFATALVAVVMLRLSADDVQYVESHPVHVVLTPSGPRTLYYGLRSSRFFNRPEQLTYVVLAPADSRVTMHGGLARQHHLTTPDDLKISSSSIHQLYEIVDGRTRWRDERITLEELRSYTKSSPAVWSLEALVRHAEQSRLKN